MAMLPFRLPNAPNSIMGLINQVFNPFSCIFVVVYFKDILTDSVDIGTNLRHLRIIM